jgi:hypothetical protein
MNRGSVSKDSHSFETQRKRPTDLAGRRYRMCLVMISCGIVVIVIILVQYNLIAYHIL